MTLRYIIGLVSFNSETERERARERESEGGREGGREGERERVFVCVCVRGRAAHVSKAGTRSPGPGDFTSADCSSLRTVPALLTVGARAVAGVESEKGLRTSAAGTSSCSMSVSTKKPVAVSASTVPIFHWPCRERKEHLRAAIGDFWPG